MEIYHQSREPLPTLFFHLAQQFIFSQNSKSETDQPDKSQSKSDKANQQENKPTETNLSDEVEEISETSTGIMGLLSDIRDKLKKHDTPEKED